MFRYSMPKYSNVKMEASGCSQRVVTVYNVYKFEWCHIPEYLISSLIILSKIIWTIYSIVNPSLTLQYQFQLLPIMEGFKCMVLWSAFVTTWRSDAVRMWRSTDVCLEICFGYSHTLWTKVSFNHRRTFTQGILRDCFIMDESLWLNLCKCNVTTVL